VSVPVHIRLMARADIRSASEYLNRQQSNLGDRFENEVLDSLTRISDMPPAFGEVDPGIRAVGVNRFGYVIYYRTDGTEVEVLAILHEASDDRAWKDRV